MRTILRRRVLTGLVVAQFFPQSPIIVTGGNPQNGKTEAGQMHRMPQILGFHDNRIIVEDKANSTVENAQFSVLLAKQADRSGITSVPDGADRNEALIRTMATAGRTVLFSAMTVALSMVAMLLFPMYFLKSFAYAGVAVVAFAAVAAVAVTPAAIVLLGDRLDSWDVRRLGRRLLRRPEPVRRPVEQIFFYRSTKFVMRHAIAIGLAIIVLLLILGAPFLNIRWGFPDDRALPGSASARQVGDQV